MRKHNRSPFAILGIIALAAFAFVACGTETVVETVIVERDVAGETIIQKVVETVIVERNIAGETVKVVETVIVERNIAGETVKVVETVIVEKVITEKGDTVVQTVIVTEKGDTITVVATPTPAAMAPPGTMERPGGIVRMANRVTQATNFDMQSTGSYVEWRAATHMHNGLVKLSPAMEVVPELIESWNYLDETTIQMKLRSGLTFHKGDALTSEDVKFSLERVALNTNPDIIIAYQGQVSAIEGVDVVDDLTFNIRTTEAFAPLLRFLALPPLSIYDKGWTEQQDRVTLRIEENGVGPFMIDSWRPGVKLELVAFEGYWEYPVAPAADRLIILPMKDSVVRVAALMSGQIDFAILPDLTSKSSIEQSACCSLTPGPDVGANRGLMFLSNQFPGNNKLIRQAMNYALDRKAIVQSGADGFAKVIGTSLIPNTSPYYADPESYNVRNVEKAKELMAEAGFPVDGPDRVVFKIGTATGSPQYVEASTTILAANMAEIGIEVELTLRERSIINVMEADDEFSAESLSFSDVLGDPDAMFRFHADNSRNHFKDDKNTELVQLGRFTIGFDKRFPIYKELQERVDDLAPSLMYMAINEQHGQSNDLRGFVFKPNRQVDWMKYAWVER
jgi:peptide/nickel transport system substrate-binding protein